MTTLLLHGLKSEVYVQRLGWENLKYLTNAG